MNDNVIIGVFFQVTHLAGMIFVLLSNINDKNLHYEKNTINFFNNFPLFF